MGTICLLASQKVWSASSLHCVGGIADPLCGVAGEKLRSGKIAELFVYDNFSRAAADEVDAGDICAVTGLSDVSIGETICSREQPEPLPTITVR